MFELTHSSSPLDLHLRDEQSSFSRIINWTALKGLLLHCQESMLLPEMSKKETWAKIPDALISSFISADWLTLYRQSLVINVYIVVSNTSNAVWSRWIL